MEINGVRVKRTDLGRKLACDPATAGLSLLLRRSFRDHIFGPGLGGWRVILLYYIDHSRI